MRLTPILVTALLVSSCLQEIECGRRSRGRSSSSSRGSSMSRRITNLFKSKKTPSRNPQSSYPKQTYNGGQLAGGTNNKGYPNNAGGGGFGSSNQGNKGYQSNIGGGGFSNPNQGGNRGHQNNIGGGGFVNPNQGNRGYQSNIGGGGFVNQGNRGGYQYQGGSFSPTLNNYQGANRYGISPSYYSYRNNFGGGYYSGGSFKKSTSIFGSGGKKAFALGAGAGFLGGAVAAAGAMSVYHRYRQLQAMMAYRHGHGLGMDDYDGYYGGGYEMGYRLNPYGRVVVNAQDCVGGCPNQAFCDYGICRCREGFEARFGACYQDFGSVYNQRGSQFDGRTSLSFNPYIQCSSHSQCRENMDMNMVCQEQKCQCRPDMKWNNDVGECQIFMDIDCSTADPKVMALDDAASNDASTAPLSPAGSNSTDVSFEGNGQTASGVAPDGMPLNLSAITANDTLKNSMMLELDVNKTTDEEIKAQFCREVGLISSQFKQQNEFFFNDNKLRDTAIGASTVVLIVLLVCCCCGCLCLCLCLSKLKDCLTDILGGGGSSRQGKYDPDPVDMGSLDSPRRDPQQPPPVYNGGEAPPYPPNPAAAPVQLPYPPAPQTDLAAYPPQPGYNPSYPPAPYPTA